MEGKTLYSLLMEHLSEEEVDDVKKIFWMINSTPLTDPEDNETSRQIASLVDEKHIIVANQLLSVVKNITKGCLF